MSALKKAIAKVGGVAKASSVCGVSQRAIYKWLATESLPRTEYTGETDYARRLAAASSGQFTADWLLAKASPKKPSQQDPATKAEEPTERRAAHDLSERRGRRETDPTGAELKTLRDCAEQALAVADRLVG